LIYPTFISKIEEKYNDLMCFSFNFKKELGFNPFYWRTFSKPNWSVFGTI